MAQQAESSGWDVATKLERSHGGVPCVATTEIRRLQAEIKQLRAQLAESISNHGACKSANSMLLDELAAIAAAEPVASHYFDIEGNLYTANRAKFLRPSLNGLTPLFTRPMPAQDVTELVELTDAQILTLWEETYVQRGWTGIEFARAIERAHGIGVKQ